MLNSYLNNLEELIDNFSNKEFLQFEGPNHQPAKIDDLVWYFCDPNTGRKVRLLCTIFHSRRIRTDRLLTEDLALPHPYNKLLKIYILSVCNKSISAGVMQSRVIHARRILTYTKFTLNELPLEIWESIRGGSHFWDFCKAHNLLSSVIRPNSNEDVYRDRTGENIINSYKDKLPDETTIQAIGQIFVNTFQDINEEGKVIPGGSIDISDAITCTFSLLSLASPNRTQAEVPVLIKQKLKSLSESDGKPVYYLDWPGSKGYKNNKNHILRALAPQVSKAINFFYRYCEPNRIIARYYINPNQTWNELLNDFQVDDERLKRLSMNNHPNIFTLAYALGYYKLDERINVVEDLNGLKGIPKTSNIKRKQFMNSKAIYSLSNDDFLYFSQNSDTFLKLMGITQGKGLPKSLQISTVNEFEDWWFDFFKRDICPSFPVGFSQSESNTFFPDLLFAFVQSDFSKKRGGGKLYAKTIFSLALPKTVASHFNYRLKPNQNLMGRNSIFYQHGFGNEMSINPNQLRHFANTVATMSNIPIEIITAWSGRKNANQTHEYIHVSEEEKSAKLKSVINFNNQDKIDIRVITKNELAEVTNLPASITSTGICTQELVISPCDYMNDFISQCFLCPSCCYIAGDTRAIDFLEKDYTVQSARLTNVKCDSSISISQAKRDWFKIHRINTSILQALVNLMKDSPKGTVISYVGQRNEFKLTELTMKKVWTAKLELPNPEEELQKILAPSPSTSSKVEDNFGLNNILSNFGLTKGEN